MKTSTLLVAILVLMTPMLACGGVPHVVQSTRQIDVSGDRFIVRTDSHYVHGGGGRPDATQWVDSDDGDEWFSVADAPVATREPNSPKRVCSTALPDWCFEIRRDSAIYETRDAGNTWRVAWAYPSSRDRFVRAHWRHHKIAPELHQLTFIDIALLQRVAGPIVVAVMPHGGAVVRGSDGVWRTQPLGTAGIPHAAVGEGWNVVFSYVPALVTALCLIVPLLFAMSQQSALRQTAQANPYGPLLIWPLFVATLMLLVASSVGSNLALFALVAFGVLPVIMLAAFQATASLLVNASQTCETLTRHSVTAGAIGILALAAVAYFLSGDAFTNDFRYDLLIAVLPIYVSVLIFFSQIVAGVYKLDKLLPDKRRGYGDIIGRPLLWSALGAVACTLPWIGWVFDVIERYEVAQILAVAGLVTVTAAMLWVARKRDRGATGRAPGRDPEPSRAVA
jgi:hypothetical protein